MYKKSIIFIATVALVFLSFACTDWLGLKPENNIVRQEYWVSKENVHSAIIGIYASLLDDNLTNRLFQWGELRSDEVDRGNPWLTDQGNVMSGIITSQNSIFDWKAFYKSINLCNTVLRFAKDAQKIDATYTMEQLKADEAEARGVRAMLYFYLVRAYGEVPLMIDAIVSDDQDIYKPKSSMSAIMNQIINDLDTADQGAFTSYGRLDYDKGRLTKYGINALQADAYLWNSDYEKCIQACDKVINSAQYGLITTEDTTAGNNDWFNENFVIGNSNESIFEFQFNVTKSNPFFDYFTPNNSNSNLNGKKYLWANYYVVGDGGLFSAINGYQPDLRAKLSSSFTSDQTIWKWVGLNINGTSVRAKNALSSHWIIYRLADIYLMKAEALNQLDRGPDAKNILALIQTRAYAPLDTTNVDNTDKDGLADLILREREKELLFEGKRWFDVLRNARRDKFRRMEVIYNMIYNYAPANLQNELIKRASDTLSLYFPIPQAEIDANPNLKQNKYYDISNQ